MAKIGEREQRLREMTEARVTGKPVKVVAVPNMRVVHLSEGRPMIAGDLGEYDGRYHPELTKAEKTRLKVAAWRAKQKTQPKEG